MILRQGVRCSLWRSAAAFALGTACLSAPIVAQDSGSASIESSALARAAAAERAGRVEDARRELEQVLASNPSSPAALAMLSQLLAPRGRAEQVLPYAEQAAAMGGWKDPVAMQVWIRTLAAVGNRDSALAVASRWITERPAEIAAYSEKARLLSASGRTDEAIGALEAGRTASGDSTILAQELAELRVAVEDLDGAAREWGIILGWGEVGVAAVAERIRSSTPSDEASVEALSERLSNGDLPVHVRRGGLSLAVELDRQDWARSLAEGLADMVPPETRRLVLRDYYVACRNRDWVADAAWAAGRLADESPDEAERDHWRAMAADAAYRAGDGRKAESTFAELAGTARVGTETHRRSLRRLFSLRAGSGSRDAAELFEQYAAGYPEDTGAIVDMAVEWSTARMVDRDFEGARAALRQAGEPSGASQVSRLAGQRGVLALLEGRPGRALAELETAAFIPDGDPVRRTDAMLLLQLLETADSTQAADLGRGMLDLMADGNPRTLEALAVGWADPARAGAAGPGLLSLSAGALDREGFQQPAAELRRSLVSAYPEAPEAPAAMLELGRAKTEADPAAARVWFERLVVDYPRHALAPVARQEISALDDEG